MLVGKYDYIFLLVCFRTASCTQEIESLSKHSENADFSAAGAASSAKATLSNKQDTINTFILDDFFLFWLLVCFVKTH